MASLRVAAGPCDAGAMPLHRPARRLPALLATTLLLAACTAQAPFAQLSGMLLDARLDEISGLAASQAHEGVLWMLDDGGNDPQLFAIRSEEHTSELQSLMRISYAVFCLKKKNKQELTT